jgi:hypothetical protein
VKYVALLTNTSEAVERWATMSPEEAAAARAEEIPKWNAAMAEIGPSIREGKELDSPATAKTVRVRDGETIVSDGPFAETKEQLGGFFLLECDNLDHAIGLAAKIPSAETASVELRPIVEH